jgi:hypothetical protein
MTPFPNAEPAERQAFIAGFRQSCRGNLYRPLADGVAVVFKYQRGSKVGKFGWLIADDDGDAVLAPWLCPPPGSPGGPRR